MSACPWCGNVDVVHTGDVTSWRGRVDGPRVGATTERVTVVCCLRCSWTPPGDWVQAEIEQQAAAHIRRCGPGLTLTSDRAMCWCGWTIGRDTPEGLARLGYAGLARLGVALSCERP